MKGRDGLKSVRRLCLLLSKSKEGGIGFSRSLHLLPRQLCSEGSSSVDGRHSTFPSAFREDFLNQAVTDRDLRSSSDFQSPNSTFSLARSITSLLCFRHVSAIGFSSVHSLASSAKFCNNSFRVPSIPFATLREVWQEDKEEEQQQKVVEGHGKQRGSDSWSHRHLQGQTIDEKIGDSSQKSFSRAKISEEIVIGHDNVIKTRQDNQLASPKEEVKRVLGWRELGWNREEVLNWPNAISMGRLVSGPLLSWMILHELWSPAFVGLVIAGISDWLDGYVARKMDMNSVLGSYLDPVADKFLVGSVAISMAYMGLLHPGLVGLIVARDGVLMGGAFIYRAYSLRWQWNDWQEFFRISIGGAGKVEPLFVSKVNTVLQLALVGVALLQPALSIQDTYSIVPVLSWSVVATTTISWVAYAYIYLTSPDSLAALKRVAHAPTPKTPRGSS